MHFWLIWTNPLIEDKVRSAWIDLSTNPISMRISTRNSINPRKCGTSPPSASSFLLLWFWFLSDLANNGYFKHRRLSHQQRPRASSLCLELVLRAAMSRSLKPTRSWWSCWNMRCSRLRCYFIRFRLFKSLPGERHKRMNTRRKLKARQNREYSKRSKAGFTGKPDWLTLYCKAVGQRISF